jgi:hypothetical protein
MKGGIVVEELEWGGMEVIHLVLLVAIAIVGHLLVVRARGRLLDRVAELTGAPVGSIVGVADAVLALLYVSFIAASVGVPTGFGVTPAMEVERMLNNVALFALYLATLNVIGLGLVYRLSYGLEGWPGREYRLPNPARA